MSKATNVVLRAKGVDQASGVFKKIAATFAAWKIGSGLRNSVGEMGKLSDVAMRAGVSSDDLTKMSLALDQIGIKGADVDSVADAMQRMTKNTGAQGIEGVESVIRELAKIPDVQERSEAAIKAFGRTGMYFLPLVEKAAKDGSSGLLELTNTMPGLSQKAAEAGDAANDALNLVVAQVKYGFLNFLGDVLEPFARKMKETKGGFATFMHEIILDVKTFFARLRAEVQTLGEIIVEVATLDPNVFRKSFTARLNEKLEEIEQGRRSDLEAWYAKLEKKGDNELGGKGKGLAGLAKELVKDTGPKYAGAILSGSYAAAQLAIGNGMNGDSPEVRETRKQTNVLNAMFKTVQHINSMFKPNSFEYGTL